ncbi:MAG TPA: GPP34 family phosphoprotein [Streptosporangiaceae bacterium]|nr:GPP34 family phosphoprotein [Streptosporangiaceae bacterium]
MDQLGDDLLLLAAGSDGRLAIPAKLRFGLAGSELVRLAAAGRVDIVRGRIVVRDTAPTGNSLLDAALASMGGSRGPTAKAWVARHRPGLVERYLTRAEAAGIIRADRRKALGFIPVTRWTVLDAGRAARARARLADAAAAAGSGPVDPALAALAGLASAIDVTRVVYPGRAGAETRKRLRQAARRDQAAADATRAVAGAADAQHATGAATRAATDAATRAATDAAVRAATDAAVSAAVDAATQAAISAATDAAHQAGGHGGHGGGGGGHH